LKRIAHTVLPRFLTGLSIIAVCMAALIPVDFVLARMERAEIDADALRHFDAGQSLMRSDKYLEAVEEFRAAVSIARENRSYRLALAEALFSGGKLDAAEQQVRELLESDPGDGQASLILARIQAREGQVKDAIFSYRRAIYGRWPDSERHAASAARWELTEYLSKQGDTDDLLAELLLLQSESPGDLDVERRVAHLYVAGGSPGRAISLFQDLLRRNYADVDARLGLAEAQFARGDYRSAERNFSLAVQLAPADQGIRDRLALNQRILALDPVLPGLAPQEQTRRALELLQLAVKRGEGCDGLAPGSVFAMRLKEAQELLKSPFRRRSMTADQIVTHAAQVWEETPQACAPLDSLDQRAISLVLRNP
jgi:Flp pilus assembly protein TadD